ncbi:MAG: aminoacetone oxidase family FAD-binding enzyme [Phycisphaerae bacterium]|nr:aminoacetone oxidase family FAD-binding enzyme [Phycisphaerae bacterium]
MPANQADVVVVGAGAAGLFAAIHAARRGRDVLLLDGAKKIGVKILVAGGGRCNVTHHAVTERDYHASYKAVVRNVLRSFTVQNTIDFFKNEGVFLKQEPTGKLFPTTDRSRTVLNALVHAAEQSGVRLEHPRRVLDAVQTETGFKLQTESTPVAASRVVLATGGRALPKSGSDGLGYTIAKCFGHTTSERIFPALVPLVLPGGHAFREVAGVALPASLTVVGRSGKRLAHTDGDLLLTHFGISGPAALDISHAWRDAFEDDHEVRVLANLCPKQSVEETDESIRNAGGKTIQSWLREQFPDRLAAAILDLSEMSGRTSCAQLTKSQRQAIRSSIHEAPLRFEGDRGWHHAEVTMGGVPLSEIRWQTMESRLTEGLHLCGEILDVDGRIGGFNFQWAWASGYLAGNSV